MRAEMSSVQLIWIHILLHFLIYLFNFFKTESFWLLMSIAQQSLALSAGREDDGERKKLRTKRKSTALGGGEVEKNTNNGMKQKQTKTKCYVP